MNKNLSKGTVIGIIVAVVVVLGLIFWKSGGAGGNQSTIDAMMKARQMPAGGTTQPAQVPTDK